MELFLGLPEKDLSDLSQVFIRDFEELRNVNFIVVGASGFLGSWISSYLTYLQHENLFDGTTTFVVRDKLKLPTYEANRQAKNRRVIEMNEIKPESFSHFQSSSRAVIIYAATSTTLSGKTPVDSEITPSKLPNQILRNIAPGHTTFVHLSSGGVYEKKARLLNAIPADTGIQSHGDDLYINEKLELERFSPSDIVANPVVKRNPRLFAFYGPGLQMDRHYAIAEFMTRARSGQPIKLKGSSENLRSYLYPTDAIHQILQQCFLKEPIHCQIGSGIPRTIGSVANKIANKYGIAVEKSEITELPVDNYVPVDVPNVDEKDFDEGLAVWDEWLNSRFR